MTLPDRFVLPTSPSGLKGLIVFLGLALAHTLGMAQNLAGLYEKAKQKDATYLSAASQLKADLETENQVFATLLPSINLGARVEKQENTYAAFGTSINASRNPASYSLTLNQTLFRPQAWESHKQSQLSSEIARLRFQQAEQDLILRLSRAYFDILTAQDNLENLRGLKEAITQQLSFAKASFEVGSTTITDQQEAQARHDLVLAQELAAENQLATSLLQLETIVGAPVDTLARLAPTTQLSTLKPSTPEAWAEQARNTNVATQQAHLAEQIAKSEIKKAQYGHLPTLDLTAQVVETEQQIFDGNSGRPFDIGVDSTTIGLVMNLPVFSGGATQSKIRQQAALLEKTSNDANLAKQTATQTAKAKFLQVQTGLAQIKALETAVASSALALQSNKTAYDLGIRINIDILNAQQQFNAAQRDLFKAKYNSLIHMLELQATVGQLDANALGQINSLLLD